MWLKEEPRDEIELKFSEIVHPGMRCSHLKASRLVTSQGTLIVASSRYITDILETIGNEEVFWGPNADYNGAQRKPRGRWTIA